MQQDKKAASTSIVLKWNWHCRTLLEAGMERADEMNAKDRVCESGKLSDWLEEMLSVPTIPESPGRKKVVSGVTPLHLVLELNGTIADFVDNKPWSLSKNVADSIHFQTKKPFSVPDQF